MARRLVGGQTNIRWDKYVANKPWVAHSGAIVAVLRSAHVVWRPRSPIAPSRPCEVHVDGYLSVQVGIPVRTTTWGQPNCHPAVVGLLRMPHSGWLRAANEVPSENNVRPDSEGFHAPSGDVLMAN
eukprot:SAG31_NODE_10421_length_1140_cov_1.388088_1_plen_125_part_10